MLTVKMSHSGFRISFPPAGSRLLLLILLVASFAIVANAGPSNAGPSDDAREDRKKIIFAGDGEDRLACDTTLRKMPDGSWAMIMLCFGHTEPLPANRIGISRSSDDGKSWSPVIPVDLGVKAKDPGRALVPSELMVNGDRCTMVVSTHNGGFGDWRTFFTHSDDSGRTWSELIPAPGRTAERTFIRNRIVTQDGRLMMPYQHYLRTDENAKALSKGRMFHAPRNPRNGVIISRDGGKTWAVMPSPCCTIPIPNTAAPSRFG